MPDPIADKYVHIHLTSGHVITLTDLSIMDLVDKLLDNGIVMTSDSQGAYVAVFRHGVAAIIATNRNPEWRDYK